MWNQHYIGWFPWFLQAFKPIQGGGWLSTLMCLASLQKEACDD